MSYFFHKLPSRFLNLYIGFSHGIDLHLRWLRLYSLLLLAASVSHYLILWDIPSWIEMALAVAGPVLLFYCAERARVRYKSGQENHGARTIFIVVSTSSIVVSSILTGLVIADPLQNIFVSTIKPSTIVWGAAGLIIGAVAMSLGKAFNADFISLKVLVNRTQYLPILSSAVLLYVATEALLLWPEQLDSPHSPTDFVKWLMEPTIAFENRNAFYIESGILVGLVIILFIISVVLYFQLASRMGASDFLTSIEAGLSLARSNLRRQFWGTGEKAWPDPPMEVVDDLRIADDSGLDEFIAATSFGALTFVYGLWSLQLVSAVGVSATVLLILVTILAGSFDIWLSVIEQTAARGVAYTIGFWYSSLLLYLLTFCVIAQLLGLVLDFSMTFPESVSARNQYNFALVYRVALGILTLFSAVAQLPYLGFSVSGRVFRYGLVTIVLLVLLSFALQTVGSINETKYLVPYMKYGAVGLTLAIVAFVPRYDRNQTEHPEGSRLFVSSAIALAPVLLADIGTSWTPGSDRCLDLRMAHSTKPDALFHLRVFVLGSEDEVASAAIASSKKRKEQVDFAITDLQTALAIIGATSDQERNDRVGFQIIAVVATIPWNKLEVPNGNGEELPYPITLDPGYLPYPRGVKRTLPEGHPCDGSSHRCRPADFSTIAHYGIYHTGDVSTVFLPEPFTSAVLRRRAQTARLTVEGKETIALPYVLLARALKGTSELTDDSHVQSIRHMIITGQENARNSQLVVDHEQLLKLYHLYQALGDKYSELSLEDLYVGLNRSTFIPRFPSGIAKSHGYDCLVKDVQEHGLLPSEDKGVKVPEKATHDDIVDLLSNCRLAVLNRPILAKSERTDHSERHKNERYLFPLAAVLVRDRPGELHRLLNLVSSQGIDLISLSSTNIGESVLVYLVNRMLLPGDVARAPLEVVLRCEASENVLDAWDSWINGLRLEGFQSSSLSALILPVANVVGGLERAIEKIVPNSINVEQAVVFQLDTDVALAAIIVKPVDWESLYMVFDANGQESG